MDNNTTGHIDLKTSITSYKHDEEQLQNTNEVKSELYCEFLLNRHVYNNYIWHGT